MNEKVFELMAEYSVCPFCGNIYRECDLEQVNGTAKCSDCGKKLVLQHVNGLHEIFSSFLDDKPTAIHSLDEKTIAEMKEWFRNECCKSDESSYYDKPQVFVNIVWECIRHSVNS